VAMQMDGMRFVALVIKPALRHNLWAFCADK